MRAKCRAMLVPAKRGRERKRPMNVCLSQRPVSRPIRLSKS